MTALGAAGHASMPRTGDNALLKLAPVLTALARQPEGFELTEAPAAMLRGLGHDPEDPSGALARIEAEDPRLRTVVEPMLGVTLTPTMSQRLEQDERHPLARPGADRLPGASGPGRGRRVAAHPPGPGRAVG